MDKNFKLILIIFFVFALIKAALTFLITSPTIFADEYFYAKMAQSYFHFKEFSVHGALTKAYPPLYAVLISPAYYFTDMTVIYSTIKLINVAISSLIIFPAYYFAKELLTNKKAVLAATLIAVLPANFVFSNYVMSENLFYLLFTVAAFFIYKSYKEDNLLWDALAGVFIGLTILTRYLGVALLVPVGVLFLYNLLKGKKVHPKFMLSTIVALIVGAWLFRNGYLFGFTIDGLLGSYIREEYPVTFGPISVSLWTAINFSIVVLSTGFVFMISMLSNMKENFRKNPTFYLLLFSIIVTVLFLLAERTAGSGLIKADTVLGYVMDAFTGRPSARYIDALAPLVIIGGFASLASKKVSKKVVYGLIVLAVLASQIVFFNLFPANNMSLFWLGAFGYLIENFTSNVYLLTVIYSAVIIAGILISAVLIKKINPNKLVALLIIFFLALSLANVAAINVNSNEWYNSDDGQLGLWINDNLTGIFLIDDKYCQNFDFREKETLCSKKNKSSLLGFWINQELRVNEINEEPVNYIITREELSLELIKELDGTFVYKVP